MTELKLIQNGNSWRIIDNHNLKKGKSYRPIFEGNVNECLEYLRQKGIVKTW